MHAHTAPEPRPLPAIALVALMLTGECIADTALTLTGRFEQRTDPMSQEMLGDAVCFFPDADSAKLLPRPPLDTRLAWFCFTNGEAARRMLGILQPPAQNGCGYAGQARVQVTHYTPYLEWSDGFDTAQLQSADKVSEGAVLPCQ